MFQKATKKQAKLRAALFGPSGAGKTFTALRMAKGLGGKIALIDTERRSASKYSDWFDFDVCELEDCSIDGYCAAIKGASDYGVLIIDSLSHGWQQLLERVEKLAQAKYRGNTWSAWSEGTPEQRQLVDTILQFPGHIIATMRSKTEWTTAQTSGGKSAPVRVGLAPEQGKGIEYEFDLLIELTTEHIANILKDRTGKFQDKLIEQPGEDFGKALADWLIEGEAIPEPKTTPALPGSEELAKRILGRTNHAASIMPAGGDIGKWNSSYLLAAAEVIGMSLKSSFDECTVKELRAMAERQDEITAKLMEQAKQ
jgi:hypothetical protein